MVNMHKQVSMTDIQEQVNNTHNNPRVGSTAATKSMEEQINLVYNRQQIVCFWKP